MTDKTTPFPHRAGPSTGGHIPQFYADGLARVSFVRGAVRLDFAQLSAARSGPDGAPPLEQNLRVVTSLEGFLATYRSMQQMVHRLAAEGKIATYDSDAPTTTRAGQDGSRSQGIDR